MKKTVLVAATIVLMLTWMGVSASAPPDPDYWPTCDSPQNIAPMQLAGGYPLYAASGVAWNGKDYAVIWRSSHADNYLHFRRFYADGTPVSPAVTVGISDRPYNANPVRIVWNGNGYAIACCAYDFTDSKYEIFFALLNENGSLIGSATRISFYGTTQGANSFNPSLAWSGSGYCVTWNDNRYGNNDIFATLLNADGTVNGTHYDFSITTSANDQVHPSIVWSESEREYVAVWSDYRSGSYYELWGAYLTDDGYVTPQTSAIVSDSSSADSTFPSLSASPNGLGLAWDDTRDSNHEIYFTFLNGSGYRIGPEVRLTNDTSYSQYPFVVWTGAEYGVFWQDERGGSDNTWFQRVDASGNPLGGNVQVTFTSDMEHPSAALAKHGYLVTGHKYGGSNYVQAWGCGYPSEPDCPENLVAYGITGTTATISWLPVQDYTTDIAYYEVFRDNTLVGTTSDNYFTDTGLTAGTTYNYAVRTVNAAQYESTGCGSTSTVYIKANASLTLMVDKSDPDALLHWSDDTMNSYNVFRGTSPQVMSNIGNTSDQDFTDPNVLLDNNVYYYTVDDPGQ